MAVKSSSVLKNFLKTLGMRFLEGLLTIVPIGATILILVWVFNAIDGFLQPLIGYITGHPIPGAGFGLLVVLIFLAGVLASNVVGRWLIKRVESTLPWLPGIRQIYNGIKQILLSFSKPRKSGFKQAVLVEFPRKGMMTIGFVTGELTVESGTKFYTVFIPNSPIPTAGFVEIVAEDEIIQTDLSVEQALQTIVSFGRIFPRKAIMAIAN